MDPLIASIAPPLLGAVIGYVTNYVAIRMLFRPLRPWRLFGLRLPLTPGVIPAKRESLAHNIGEMVGGHLLTSADVGEAFSAEAFGEQLRGIIHARVEQVLKTDHGPVASMIPGRFKPYFDAGVKVLRGRILHHLHVHIEGEAFHRAVKSALSEGFDGMLARKADDTVSPETWDALFHAFEEGIGRFLESSDFEEHFSSLIMEKIEEIPADSSTCRDLLGEDLAAEMLATLEGLVPWALSKAGEALDSAGAKERLVQSVWSGLDRFLDSLGPMAAIVRNFVDPEILGGKLREYLAQQGESFAEWFLDKDVQGRVTGMVREKAESFLERPVADLFAHVPPEKKNRFGELLAGRLVTMVRGSSLPRMAAALVEEKMRKNLHLSLGHIVGNVIGADSAAKAKTWLIAEGLKSLRSARARRIFDDLVMEFVEKKIFFQPLGPLSGLLPREVRHGIGDYIFQQSRDLLIKEVPVLLDSLNIRQIVARKVNTLDLPRLESLLLGIMQEQFKYINLFGALLGFIIGLLNLFF